MIKQLLALFIFGVSLFAALPANTTWEVRNAGTDTNGGGFKAGGTGTDYSQQNSAQFSGTDLASTNGTTNPCVVTSATHNFVATDVDNIIQISAGTNWTAGFYQIVSTATNAATLDRACGSSATLSSGTWAVGGALKTLSKLNTAMSTIEIQQFAWVKADTTYSVSSTQTFNFFARATSSIQRFVTIQGYSSTRGDEGTPTIQASAGSFAIITIANNNNLDNLVFANFILDCNSQTSSTGLDIQNNFTNPQNLKFTGCSTGFKATGFAGECTRCYATGMLASGFGFSTNSTFQCYICYAGDSSASGVTGFGMVLGSCFSCFAVNLTGGSTSDGFGIGTLSLGGVQIVNSTCYNVTRDCYSVSHPAASNLAPLTILNSIAAKPGRYGFNAVLAVPQGGWPEDYNACWLSTGTACYNNWTAGAHDVTLSADPFTNGASQNFALNNTAGGGAAAKGVGFPGVLKVGGTGSLDLGGLQHVPSGGSGTIVSGYSQ